ncbi:hypothetical protein [Streptomyces sp. NPDC057257]|uniref:hypothetical protein n=1 Tax=Streptomyces sp. NPDC057257 TaxID=3346071 RepID=UPI00363F7BBE
MPRRRDSHPAQGPEALLPRLRDKRFNGYLGIRLPHELDDTVEAIVVAHTNGSASLRQKMADAVDGRAAAVLSAYGQRMASMAVRTLSVGPLRRGLVAVSLAEGRLEQPYDNLFVLAALNDAAALVGTTLHAVLADVARVLPPAGHAAIQEFDRRQDRDKSLEAMGLSRTGTGPTFLYG